jgi:hypothetical protein
LVKENAKFIGVGAPLSEHVPWITDEDKDGIEMSPWNVIWKLVLAAKDTETEAGAVQPLCALTADGKKTHAIPNRIAEKRTLLRPIIVCNQRSFESRL